MTTAQTIIRCSNITKSYVLNNAGGARLDVLRGIDLEVREGEIVAIVGASGSGKSTLLHIMGGLDQPTSGSIFWLEQEIFKLNDEDLAKVRGTHVGFVFQFHHLLPEFTALENVMIPLMIHRTPSADAVARAKEVLHKVGLSERYDHKPGELSGGEQQRVAVARALANRPKIIFADEPTGNLDSVNSRQLHDIVSELNRTDRQTFVIVTHNEAFASQAHRVFRMLDGKLQQA